MPVPRTDDKEPGDFERGAGERARTRFLAIVNPVSGRRNVRPRVDATRRALEQRGAAVNVRYTERGGHATEIAAAEADGFDAVLVVGGDGTVSEVVNGLIGSRVPIAILPTGTENLLARELGMPRSPEVLARLLVEGFVRPHDVGQANGRNFVAVTGVGFDAECVDRLVARRRGHISRLSYALPILQTFLSYRFPPIRVEADGETVFEGRGLAMVGIIRTYASKFHLFQRAVTFDGLLDLVVFRCSGKLRLTGHAINLVLRRHLKSRSVIYGQHREIGVSSDVPLRHEVDGEAGGDLPVRYTIQPQAVQFLCRENIVIAAGGSPAAAVTGDARRETAR